MIAYLKGTLEETGEDYIVVDVNDIGYQVRVSGRVIAGMPPTGSLVKIYTYTYVREDMLALYGFLTKDDLEMFQLLLGVSGVGPKGALGILSMFSAEELRIAVISQDAKTIAKAPGIGNKTAQRLLIDLKDRVSLEDTYVSAQAASSTAGGDGQLTLARNDALEALTALGYSPSEALAALKKLEITEDMDSEAILKAALRRM